MYLPLVSLCGCNLGCTLYSIKGCQNCPAGKEDFIIFLAVTGFIGMLILMASAGFLAPLMVEEDPEIMANVIRILSVAIF